MWGRNEEIYSFFSPRKLSFSVLTKKNLKISLVLGEQLNIDRRLCVCVCVCVCGHVRLKSRVNCHQGGGCLMKERDRESDYGKGRVGRRN